MSFVVAALCGGALVLALAPFDFWPLALVGAGGLYWLLDTRPAHCGRIALGFGLAKYGIGLSWIYVSIHVYGQAPPPLAGGLVLLLALIMTAIVWLQCLAWLRLRTSHAPLNWLVFASVWTVFEWAWTWWLSGFPWLFAGYSQLETPLAGFAPVGGVFLVSWLVALCGAALVDVLRRRWSGAVAVLAVGFCGYLLDGIRWTTPGETQRVALVQGNTAQAVKWEADQRDAIVRTHIRLSAPYWGKTDLIVWPEGAVTWWAHEADALLDRLNTQGLRSGTALVTGIPLAEREGSDVFVYNSVVAVGAGHGQYRKQVLVPFGEFVPFEGLLRGLIAFFDLPMSAFARGPAGQPLLRLHDLSAAMLICYEIAYPEVVRSQSRGADVVLTISNDTWFGSSIGPLQHMQIAQMRALELGRWVLRATNNGLTGIVNPRGELVASIPQFEEGVLVGDFRAATGMTPYQRFGHTPVLILAGLLCIAAWVLRRREAQAMPRV